jgi:lysozyme
MKVSDILMTQLMVMEGLSLEAYEDCAGVPTIGYGHTKNVQMGDRISKYWAKELLKDDVREVEQQVLDLNVAQTQGQFDALVSFTFNLGIGRLKSSTLLKVIREGGSKNAIKKEFKRWVYAGGKKLRGLELRREWEAKRFFD